MSEKVLIEDWSDYDNKKIKGRPDSKDFACTETWEVDYLVGKYRKLHPDIRETLVRQAITACCGELKSPHPRKPFVACVSKKLGIR
jgi:hypothetical protein